MLTAGCAQKTSKLAAPDPFKSTSQAIKEGSRKVGENKLLSRPGSSKNRFQVRILSIVLDDLEAHAVVASHTKVNVRTVSPLSPRTRRSTVTVCSPHSRTSHPPAHGLSRIGCAYKRGVCAICGKQVLDTTGYVMSSK